MESLAEAPYKGKRTLLQEKRSLGVPPLYRDAALLIGCVLAVRKKSLFAVGLCYGAGCESIPCWSPDSIWLRFLFVNILQ